MISEHGARRLVTEVWKLVNDRTISARSPAGDAALDLRDEIDPKWNPVGELLCTGIMAQWCPIHGDCTCPPDPDGYRNPFAEFNGENQTAFDCPLHGETSGHATAGMVET